MPIVHLVVSILIGIAVGLVAAWRKYGGVVTLIASTGAFALALLSFRFRWIGFLASGGGVGLLLIILGMYVSLAVWAHERVREPTNKS